MSWKSQQGYALGVVETALTEASTAHASGDNIEVYVSPSVPVGVWLIIVNGVTIPVGDLTQAVISIYQVGSADPIASLSLNSDVIQFPTLSVAFVSDGTKSFTVDVSAETSAGTWDIGVGKVQIVKLTNV
jgi:hypothetical protein